MRTLMLVNPWSGHDTLTLTHAAAAAWSEHPDTAPQPTTQTATTVEAIPWGWAGTDLHTTLQQAVITGTYAEPVALSIEDVDPATLTPNSGPIQAHTTIGHTPVRLSVTYASGGVDVMIPAGPLLTPPPTIGADGSAAPVTDTTALGTVLNHVATTFGTRLRRLVVALPDGADEPTTDVDAGAGLLEALGVIPTEPVATNQPAGPSDDPTTSTSSWAAQHHCELIVTTASDEPFFLPGIRPGRRLEEAVLHDAERNHKRRLRLAERVGAACGDRWMQQAVGTPGAGACGGAAFGLFVAGAQRRLGPDLLASLMGLADRVAEADVVVVMPEVFDWRQLRSSSVTVAAELAAAHGVPCVVLAGAVEVGRRELGAAGVHAAYGCVTEPTDATGKLPGRVPADAITSQVRRVRQTWAREG